MTISAERLLEAINAELEYNSATGVFTRIRTGRRAGTEQSNGYRRVSVSGMLVREHKAAWLVTYGEFPNGVIDHINGDKADNRIVNLRGVSRSANNQNRTVPSKSSLTGFLGVHRKNSGYRASIGVDGRMIFLGMYPTAEAASEAYWRAKREYHPFAVRGMD